MDATFSNDRYGDAACHTSRSAAVQVLARRHG